VGVHEAQQGLGGVVQQHLGLDGDEALLDRRDVLRVGVGAFDAQLDGAGAHAVGQDRSGAVGVAGDEHQVREALMKNTTRAGWRRTAC